MHSYKYVVAEAYLSCLIDQKNAFFINTKNSNGVSITAYQKILHLDNDRAANTVGKWNV
jgi:hypothetical protein